MLVEYRCKEARMNGSRLYEDFVKTLNIKRGTVLWLSSDAVRIASSWKEQGGRLDLSILLDVIQDAVGPTGTILIPTFCFDFSNKQYYDYRNTKGITGALGNVALRRNDYVRTTHPMHSFAVWGNDQDLLCSMINKNSFGADSPFEYCLRTNAVQIMLGVDYNQAFTFVHFVEAICKVPYRFLKTFEGVYINRYGASELRTYEYPARKAEIQTTEQFNRIGAILEERGIAKISKFHSLINREIKLSDSFDVIRDDILRNACHNIYDFDVPRDVLFNNYIRS